MIVIDVDCKTCGIADGCERVWKNPDAAVTCVSWTPPKMTNGDKIRAMTDEELARKIADLDCQMNFCPCDLSFCAENGCVAAWMSWLGKEEEEWQA